MQRLIQALHSCSKQSLHWHTAADMTRHTSAVGSRARLLQSLAECRPQTHKSMLAASNPIRHRSPQTCVQIVKPGTNPPSPPHGSTARAPAPSQESSNALTPHWPPSPHLHMEFSTRPHFRVQHYALALASSREHGTCSSPISRVQQCPHSTWSTGPSLFSGVPSGHRILTEHSTRLTQEYSIGPHLLTSTWSSALGRTQEYSTVH